MGMRALLLLILFTLIGCQTDSTKENASQPQTESSEQPSQASSNQSTLLVANGGMNEQMCSLLSNQIGFVFMPLGCKATLAF